MAPAPLVASDEKGVQVQWLAGPRSPAETRMLAVDYGRQMQTLRVDVNFAPVVD